MPSPETTDERAENDNDLHSVSLSLLRPEWRLGLIDIQSNYSLCKVEIILLCCLETDGFICQAALSAPVYTWRDNGVGFNLSHGSQMCHR